MARQLESRGAAVDATYYCTDVPSGDDLEARVLPLDPLDRPEHALGVAVRRVDDEHVGLDRLAGGLRDDDRAQAGLVGDSAHGRDVQHVQARVAQALAEEQLGVGLDGSAPGVQIAGAHKAGGDAEARRGVAIDMHGSLSGVAAADGRNGERRSAKHEAAEEAGD